MEEAAIKHGEHINGQFIVNAEKLISHCKDKLQTWPPLLHREFCIVSNNAPKDFIFRVMQWNILADALCKGKDNFVKCPKEALQWEMRKYLILQEILTYMPDIFCLQEVDHFDYLSHKLENIGYHGIFLPKPDSPCLYIPGNDGPDGCALFYKVDKFCEKFIETYILKAGSTLTNHVVILCILQCKQYPNSEIMIIVTHLKAKRGNEMMRYLQGQDLLKFIEEKHTTRPIIICGDFNGDPKEPVYDIITNSNLNLSSAYTKFPGSNSEPQYTSWKIRGDGEVCITLDYIFYSTVNFDIYRLLRFPTGEQIGKDRLPSCQYPSDHFSLVVDFKILH